MLARALGFLLAVVVLAGLQPLRAPFAGTAHACSGPGELPEDPVVVEGWVARLTLRPDLVSQSAADRGDRETTFVPVQVTLRDARVLYGRLPQPVSFFDVSSVHPLRPYEPDGAVAYIGASGACGTLDRDETGRYAIAVLRSSRSGLRTVLRTEVAYLDSPSSARAAQVRESLRGWIVTLPTAGGAGAAGVARLGVAVLSLALTAAGALCMARGRRA